MKTALILGAAGFMGSYLFEFLQHEGLKVYGIDNYSIGTYKHPFILDIDLLDKKKVELAMLGIEPDVIFFLAAWAHEGLSQFAPKLVTENNYNIYLNTLVPAIKQKVKKIVVCSSMSVYGGQEPPFTEDMSRQPEDIYAVAKTAMEQSTEIMSRVYDFEYTIIRPHNVYGPRQNMADPYRNVAAIFINRCLANLPITIYGDGEQKRAFSYIDDVIPYLAKAGLEDFNKEIINIGPTEEFTINELASEILKYFPDVPPPVYLPDRPVEVKNAWCSNKKAMDLLGYKTSTTFQEGIYKMVEWAIKKGHQEPKYLKNLELVNERTPLPWKESS